MLDVTETDPEMMSLSKLADSDDWAGIQQLRLAFSNSILSLTANIFCAFVIVVLLWPIANNQGLLAWLGSICVLALIRLSMQQKFEKADIGQGNFRQWKIAFVASAGITGLAWGALSIYLFPQDSVLHQAYLTFVLGGVCAGAVSAYAPLYGAFPAFCIPVLMPYAYSVWTTGSAEATMMSLLVAVFMFILLRTAQQSRNNVSDVLALQVRNADLTRALHHRATHDSLVDLVNHGEFNRRLERLAKEERREGSEYSLVFIDLDMFKEVNDSGGHAAGDKILKGVANILRNRTRAADTTARVGGDEFAILLEGCPHRRAQEIGEGIRKDIEALSVDHEKIEYSLTASIGISYGKSDSHSASSMLKAADAACYTSKQQGRNQVHINAASDLFESTDRFDLSKGGTPSS